MRIVFKPGRSSLSPWLAALGLAIAGSAFAQQMSLKLSGDQEVPPVKSQGSGEAKITVAPDRTVSGEVMTTGIKGTMAHIHEGAAGENGPVSIPLKDAGEGKWVVPEGSKLSDKQFEALKAGKLYVNVHTAENKGGELRAQLKP